MAVDASEPRAGTMSGAACDLLVRFMV